MSDLVQVTVVGRLTRDAELREAGSQSVCGFRVAATPYRQDGALFFDVSVWGRRGEALVEYLGKGQQVVVVGGLSTRTYTTKEGEERTVFEINATEVNMVGGKRDAAEAEPQAPADDDGDIPF